MHYRAVFISDLHLGTPGCQAEALIEFLKSHTSNHLYLIGDIIDGWQLKRKWYWPQAHNDVVQKLLRKARKGCHVVFIPGNHDEFARGFIDHHFGGVEVCHETSHTKNRTANINSTPKSSSRRFSRADAYRRFFDFGMYFVFTMRT